MRKIRVNGHAIVTVSVLINVEDDEILSDDEIFDRARENFGGLYQLAGNGGLGEKMIGVYGDEETVSADEEPEFDDYMEE